MKRNTIWSYMIILNIIAVAAMIAFAYYTSDSVTALSENAVISERRVVVIDAGHGGIDGGATSFSGILESKTNLQIALRLRDVCHLLGIKTVMIRTEDVSIYTSGQTIAAKKISDLKERVRIVNEIDNCTLISIHQNYFYDSKYSGAQVFYNQNEFAEDLAAQMQKAFINSLNRGSNRKHKKAEGIYLMQNTVNPGILIECGFISNEKEDMLLQSPQYQKKLCMVIGSVLSSNLIT